MQRDVTRADVAAAAGTSTAVVSYVLNDGPRRVAPATRRRVLDAVERLGYRPNSLAAGLSARRTRLVGLVVPDLTRPFFAEMATRLADVLQRRGLLAILVSTTWSADRESAYLEELVGMRVRGVIMAPATGTPATAALAESGVPVVLVSGEPAIDGTPLVISDAHHAGRLATRHLFEHGFTSVACLTGPQDAAPVGRRVDGWREEVEAQRPGVDDAPLLRAGFDRYSAEEVAGDYLQQCDGPVALMAATDELALGALAAAARLGRRVPEDFAVVGCDGIPEGRLSRPPLTTVAEPVEQLCDTAVDCLLAEESTRCPPPAEVWLRVGGSCGHHD